MSEIHGIGGPLPAIPDDMSVAQFMLDYHHPFRPVLAQPSPWLIEDSSGRKVWKEEIYSRTDALANSLSARWKIGENDVVSIFSPNSVDYPVIIWAVHRLGAIVSPLNPTQTAEELKHQLKSTSPKLLLAHSSNYATALAAAQIVGIAPDRVVLVDTASGLKDPAVRHATLSELIDEGVKQPKSFVERKLNPGEAKSKLAFLSFSSGTTGLPKAIRISHYALIANMIQVATFLKTDKKPLSEASLRPGTVILAVLPFYHAYGLAFVMHFTLFHGATLVVIPKFNFTDMLKSIERYRINYLPLVPPVAVLFCKHPDVKKYDLSSVRAVVCGAAPLSGELMTQLATLFPEAWIGQGFGSSQVISPFTAYQADDRIGMTETFTMIAMASPNCKVADPSSAGVLISGLVARVVRADGSLAPPGEPGEFVISTPSLALGYLDEKATKETFRDGWLYTGDEVIINEKAELFVVDRIKELLKVRAFQVAPAELEGFLLQHPDVADTCVVSLLDDFNGDLPLAYVVPSAAAQARMETDPAEGDRIKAALIKYVADGKTSYKQLTGGVEFTDVIPKLPSGKLLRRSLRDRARQMAKQGLLTSVPKAKL
ncbi:uncharacterized protein FIBRA_05075 [Fibroporia radiculosa]|uniref:AMP-dependent synthetase/ligase domain-containing protein n=1 Tax=Fibroporia radiculosa TaxID=599839 RepID=J4GQC6_9APHY|nr:uncharacterized protein FIBRA_05075 [Fibroporia radiculosa]CCM02960.1 predicted protein [Fibroporia radiculosa]